MNKFHIVAASVLVLVILAMGAILFSQQRDISRLKTQVFGDKTVSGTAKTNQKSAVTAIEGPEKQTHFTGEIKAITASGLAVAAKLTKVKDPSKIKAGQPVVLRPEDYEDASKTVNVALSEKTSYLDLKKEDLKVGDKILVAADKSPFIVDSLTALQIAKIAVPKNGAPQ